MKYTISHCWEIESNQDDFQEEFFDEFFMGKKMKVVACFI